MSKRRYKFDPHPSDRMRQFSPPGGSKPGSRRAVAAGDVFVCEDNDANRAIIARLNSRLKTHKEQPAILDLGLVDEPKPPTVAEVTAAIATLTAPETEPAPEAPKPVEPKPAPETVEALPNAADGEPEEPAKAYPQIPRLNGATADLAAYLKEHDGADVDNMDREAMIERLKQIRDLQAG